MDLWTLGPLDALTLEHLDLCTLASLKGPLDPGILKGTFGPLNILDPWTLWNLLTHQLFTSLIGVFAGILPLSTHVFALFVLSLSLSFSLAPFFIRS